MAAAASGRQEEWAATAPGWQVRARVDERSGAPASLLTFPFEVQAPAVEQPPTAGLPPDSPQAPILLCPQGEPGWEAISPPRRLSSAQVEAARRRPLPVLVTVRVPSGRTAGTRGEVRLRVAEGESCEAPSRVLAEAVAHGVVAPHRELALQAEGPATAAPGRRWSGRVTVRNLGNRDEEVALALRSNLRWPAWAQPDRLRLPAFGEQAVTIDVQVPDEAGLGLVLLLTVEAATIDGSVRRQADVRVVVDWPGGRGPRPQATRVMRGQLGVEVGWPVRASEGAGSASKPSATANLRLGSRLPGGNWEAGVSGHWSPPSAGLSWPWVVARDARGQEWGLGTGTPALLPLLGQRPSGASPLSSLASLSVPQPDGGRLRFGLLGGRDGALLVAERAAPTGAVGRRWAIAAGSLGGVAALEAEGRLAVWRQQDRFADLVGSAAWAGVGAGAVGLEVGGSVWKAALWWDEAPAGFAGSANGSSGVRLEGWAQPAQGRSAGAWVQRRVSGSGSGPSESVEWGVRVQPAQSWALQWHQRHLEGRLPSRSLHLFVRGGPPGGSWFARFSAEQPAEPPGEWRPELQVWFPVGRAGQVLWQPGVTVERGADGRWDWKPSAWARYEPPAGRLGLVAQGSLEVRQGFGVGAAELSVALERTFSPWLVGRLGLSAEFEPSSPPGARAVAGFTYQFSLALPEPRGTVRGRLVGWQERDPAFRWPALAVWVDGAHAGELQPDGTFVLREVPAGRRHIQIEARQFPAMWMPPAPVEVEVAADRESLVELPVAGAGVLEGLCFADLNEDGVRQPDEPPFGGCAVQARLGDGLALSVGADASGRWQLSGVRPGRYEVRAVGSGLPDDVRQAAGQLAPWLVVLARMGGASRWSWPGGPTTVELVGWPHVARLEIGLRPPASAPPTGPRQPTEELELALHVEPETAPPGAELRVRLEASAPLAEVELAVGPKRLRLEGAGDRREAWVAVPDTGGAEAGVLVVAVRAQDARGRQAEQRAVVLVDPQVPLLRAQLRPVVVRAGEWARLELEALARLTGVVVQTPWGEVTMAPEGPAPSLRWQAAVAVPPDAAAGLHTLTVRGQTVAGREVETTLRLRVRP